MPCFQRGQWRPTSHHHALCAWPTSDLPAPRAPPLRRSHTGVGHARRVTLSSRVPQPQCSCRPVAFMPRTLRPGHLDTAGSKAAPQPATPRIAALPVVTRPSTRSHRMPRSGPTPWLPADPGSHTSARPASSMDHAPPPWNVASASARRALQPPRGRARRHEDHAHPSFTSPLVPRTQGGARPAAAVPAGARVVPALCSGGGEERGREMEW
jgi:hypothetical protein